MKILLLDIETSPNLAYVWGIWAQNVNPSHLVSSSTTLCWSAKWLGDKEIQFASINNMTERQMLKGIHKLLDEADVVVHYNGKSFDVPTLNKEFLKLGFKPPSPYKQIDLLQVARRQFRFQSNRLDYVAQQLGLGNKFEHEGFQLWIKCLHDDQKAWKDMQSYNMHDVVLLEAVYQKMLPWIPNHPNYGAYVGKECCSNCGSKNVQGRGMVVTQAGKYRRFQCRDCGSWMKGRKAITAMAALKTA